MLAIATRVLLLAIALLTSGCATCGPRERGGDPVVISGRPG